jgi:hypothetical protein
MLLGASVVLLGVASIWTSIRVGRRLDALEARACADAGAPAATDGGR